MRGLGIDGLPRQPSPARRDCHPWCCGLPANSADHRAKPARGSGRPSSIHRDPLVDPTVTNHRAACHGTGLGRPRSRDGQRLYQGRQSARARCAWPVENEAPGNRVPFVAPQRESRPGGRCGTHDWGSGMNGRDPAELRPQGQPFSPAGWACGTGRRCVSVPACSREDLRLCAALPRGDMVIRATRDARGGGCK